MKRSESDSTSGCTECNSAISTLSIQNRPGLSTLSYRIGTYSEFKSRMLFSLSQNKELAGLTTRQDDDLAIALLDCWAVLADILTFYQERIANEGFLRTAKERRSIKELARLLGYELRPGVAASTFLAFTIEESAAAGVVDQTTIKAGTKVKSVPAADETPQVFETVNDIQGRPEWNSLWPLANERQNIVDSGRVLVFKGIHGVLKPGNLLLAVAKFPDGAYRCALAKVSAVKTDSKSQTTTVETFGFDKSSVLRSIFCLAQIKITKPGLVKDLVRDLEKRSKEIQFAGKKKLESMAKSDILASIAEGKVTESQLRMYATKIGWEKKKLVHAVNHRPTFMPEIPLWIFQPPKEVVDVGDADALVEPQIGFYALKESAAFFGHNAPKYAALPEDMRREFDDWDASPMYITNVLDSDDPARPIVVLDNTYQSLIRGSWMVFKDGSKYAIRRVAETIEKSLANFAMSAKVTAAVLTDEDLEDSGSPADFEIRDTTAYFHSELLELADIPIMTPVQGSTIKLDRLVADLRVGQYLSFTGRTLLTREDGQEEPTEVTESEIAVISEIIHDGAHTTLKLAKDLVHTYVRDDVVINANTVQAIHGETKQEAVGSGEPSKPLQEFVLKQKPLTFVSSSVAEGGAASTLSLYVDNILWKQVKDLNSAGPNDRAYVLRLEDEDEKGYGATKVIFGDGKNGIRPPAGTNNIVARYKVGMGNDGMVKKDQLSMLLSRPLGVKSVTNPVPASGAADPEMIEHARINASLPLIAMGRIVSLKDFEDFARAFAGIGKAKATWMWDGERKVVFLTVASDTGDIVSDDLYATLAEAIERSKDPSISVRIMSFEPIMFKVTASVAVAKDHLTDFVFDEVREALLNAFSFESRTFAQSVNLSEIVSVIQHVKGVEAAHIDALYLSTEASPTRMTSIPAHSTRWKGGDVLASELLTIDPDGISLGGMASQ